MPFTAADARKLDERIAAQQQRVRAAETKFSAWLVLLNAREDQSAMSLRLLDAALREFEAVTWKRDVDSRIKSDLLQLGRAREAATKCLPHPTAQQRKGEHLLGEIARHRASLRNLKNIHSFAVARRRSADFSRTHG
jgi:hypothetical protein